LHLESGYGVRGHGGLLYADRTFLHNDRTILL
jgi:hypothetical protein